MHEVLIGGERLGRDTDIVAVSRLKHGRAACVQKVKTVSQLNDRPKHGRLLYPLPLFQFIRPGNGAIWSKLPEVDARAQPVVVVLAGLQGFSGLQHSIYQGFIAAVVGDDGSLVVEMSHGEDRSWRSRFAKNGLGRLQKSAALTSAPLCNTARTSRLPSRRRSLRGSCIPARSRRGRSTSLGTSTPARCPRLPAIVETGVRRFDWPDSLQKRHTA